MRDVFAEHWLMSDLRDRPQLYFGQKRAISLFSTYLAGYGAAYVELQKKGQWDGPDWDQPELGIFTGWLAQKYKIRMSLDWCGMLLLLHDCDEVAAFDAFWKEWDEFCQLDETVMKNDFLDEKGDFISYPDKYWTEHDANPDKNWQRLLNKKLKKYIKKYRSNAPPKEPGV